jgi:transcriptional regulator with XRE-family HTH domain
MKEIKNTLLDSGVISECDLTRIKLIANIKHRRLILNVTQTELSKISGVPQKTISRMENFLSIPSLETVIKLLHSLNLELDIKEK